MANDANERAELIKLLESMGVWLPSTAKLPNSSIRRRIVQAFDLTQMLTELFGPGRGPNIEELESWSGNLVFGMCRLWLQESARLLVLNKAEAEIGAFDIVRSHTGILAGLYESKGQCLFLFVDFEDFRRTILLKVRRCHPILQAFGWVTLTKT